jgi:hypothetical protein
LSAAKICAPLNAVLAMPYSAVEMNSPSASAPISGWSPKHGQPGPPAGRRVEDRRLAEE